MRRASRRDENEPAIVDALRAAGWVVERVSSPGFPDLVCARHGMLVLLEVKTPKGSLTPLQAEVFNRLEAHPAGLVVPVVRTPDEAVRAAERAAETWRLR